MKSLSHSISTKPMSYVLFAVSSLFYFPLSHWLSTTPIGSSIFVWGQIFYLLPLLAAILAFPCLSVGLLFQSVRSKVTPVLLISILFIPTCFGGLVLGRMTRMSCMRSFAARSQPLIQAIRGYERVHGVPPKSLDQLVPIYLPKVPSTGMMAYPEYRYRAEKEVKNQYHGNEWVLYVYTPSGGINFDMMLYFPNQNYPMSGYGGRLEKVRDWAYVHE